MIYGDVTGVGFRYFVRSHALKLEVNGWVRNATRSCVEGVFEGEKENIDKLIEHCRKGPEVSWVEKVEVEEEEVKDEFLTLEIRY